MELIVNDLNFSEDFKKALGFVDADINYERLEPYLEIATDDVIDILTKESYTEVLQYKNTTPDLVEGATETPDPETSEPDPNTEGEATTALVYKTFSDLTEEDKEHYVRLIRYVVLMRAFNMYVGLGDLNVSNNGRTIRRDEHNASAFQWQIEKHDGELEQMYYRHLDRLLRFMSEHELKINQKKYAHHELLMNSLSLFESFLDVKGSYALYIKLLPGIREAERMKILPRTGKDLFAELKADRDTDISYVAQKAVVSAAMVWGIYKLELQAFPKGTLSYTQIQGITSGRNSGEARVFRQTLALSFEKDLQRDLEELESRIKQKNTPEYTDDADDDIDLDLGFDEKSGFVSV